MANRKSLYTVSLAALVAASFGGVTSAQYSIQNGLLPTGPGVNSNSENVDFGDLDNDGDWDAAFADGGDDGDDQNRLWINQGPANIGIFADVTSTQMPQLERDSRDIEMADIDMDGDLDMYSSNTANFTNQGNHWYINQGGLQGGTLAFFTDDTDNRWIGLGGPGSSIPGSLLINDTFVDWSCDCDFGDMDNDGDLDLFHSTYGGAFGGQVPSRIFLNDGAGFFSEFQVPTGNPLMFSGSNIVNGSAGIWSEGTQQANTGNANGTSCDIASTALDIDLMDMDGDLDLDVLHGARQESPRIFKNMLEENGGSTLSFRDVTNAVLPGGFASGGNNYEQEMGDFDNDGDLDLYGLNWNGFGDVTFINDGNGNFSNKTSLAGSGADDNEGDFVDYDNDGDLDLYVANFGGQDKMYRNNFIPSGTHSYTLMATNSIVPSFGATSLDADACDVDGDGDYDIMVAEDNFQANTYLRNDSNVPDTTAPDLYRLETVTGGAANGGSTPVRVQVYDNAPYYITWYNDTNLSVSVDGFNLGNSPMMTSGGQIFRGTICNNYVGTVSYRAGSADEYGNFGSTPAKTFVNTGNTGVVSGPTTDSSAGTPGIRALAEAYAGKPLPIVVSNVGAGSVGFIGFSGAAGTGTNFGDGLIDNVGLGALIGDLIVINADGNGDALLNITKTPALPGLNLFAQAIMLDGVGGNTFSSTQGLAVTLQ